LSPEERARLIEALVDAGLPRIQIGSFVNPRRVPQMAGTELVWQRIRKQPAIRYSTLVLNARGLDLAIAADVPHVEIYVSASQTHSMRNSGTTVEKALAEAVLLVGRALGAGLTVTAGVMCAFGCFYEGNVPVETVRSIVEKLQDASPTEIGLADTTGMAEPDSVRRVIHALDRVTRVDPLALHLHDTHGFAWPNLMAALEMGIRKFDTSVGGLGGCPFIPGATGNIATETTVERLHSLGYRTGVDAEKVREAASRLRRLLAAAPEFR